MKISKLLASRQALLRQTQLANLANAYTILQRLAARIALANLRGLVRLRPADPEDECYWASLTALEGSQAVLEEHFTDNELLELAEAIGCAIDSDFCEIDFRLEDVGERFVEPLRQTLEQEGVSFDLDPDPQNLAPDNAE